MERHIYRLEDVFDESKFPDLTFVPIKEYPFLQSAIRTAGKHITLSGPSGSGKTTIIKRLLLEEKITDNDLFWINAREYENASNFLELFAMSLSEPNIKLESVFDLLSCTKFVIIDDFHFLPKDVRFEIAQKLKLLHEKHIRFILIGITSSAQELVGVDSELGIRNAPFELKTQDADFTNALISKGEELLNFNFSSKSKDDIISASSGIPSIVHIICRNALIMNSITETLFESQKIEIDFERLKKEIIRIFDAKYFNQILAIAKGKGQSTLNTYFDIIEAISRDSRLEIPIEDIKEKLLQSIKDEKKRKRKSSSLQSCLVNLADVIKSNNSTSLIYYNKDSNVIAIEDPSLRFYLNLFDIEKLRNKLRIRESQFTYDVAISFAGEDRVVAEDFKRLCEQNGLSVFYDFDRQAQLWGRDLSRIFTDVYRYESNFMVILVSDSYKNKDWTNYEFANGKDAEKERSLEYLLPIRIDDSHIKGLKETVSYMDLRTQSMEQIVDALIEKINNIQ
ncbi:MAG: TIR domain-containing protein [Candidatus Symbiothrix sp.]|jgi:GTPase SAR1 family protein|nr:TIR domain-containing protein [Candidatus Symbiothrix sp.]